MVGRRLRPDGPHGQTDGDRGQGRLFVLEHERQEGPGRDDLEARRRGVTTDPGRTTLRQPADGLAERRGPDLSRRVRCLPVALRSPATTHRDDQSRRTPENHPARITAYACFAPHGDGRPCQGNPGTTRSCGCDVDDGHLRSRIAHFTIGHGDAIRTAFKTQKNRSTERFVRKIPIFTPSVQ